MRCLAQVLMALAAGCCVFAGAAVASAGPTIQINTSAYVVEPGTTFTISVTGKDLGNVAAYQAQLAVPTGLVVNSITKGNLFQNGHMVVKDTSKPWLLAMSSADPYYESAGTATLASFSLTVPSTTRPGHRSISTAGSLVLDELSRNVISVRQSSFMLDVTTPRLAMSEDFLAFPGVAPGDAQTQSLDVTNTAPLGTFLNTAVAAPVLSYFNNEPADGQGIACPWRFVGSPSAFDLAGNATQSATLNVEFAPQQDGYYYGYFDIVSDDGVGGSTAEGTITRIYLEGVAAAPEPATLTLLALGTMVLSVRRRK